VFGYTKRLEPVLWLLIAGVCAFVIAKQCRRRQFLHGFFVGLIGGTVASLIQALLFQTYSTNNPRFIEDFGKVSAGISARTFILALTPIIGVIGAILLGLLCWGAGKVFRAQ
jgi:uncharacterized membrane protein YeaQ/YmgE (transglycosylase-associated protein family)